jgi:hypothetical protein
MVVVQSGWPTGVGDGISAICTSIGKNSWSTKPNEDIGEPCISN